MTHLLATLSNDEGQWLMSGLAVIGFLIGIAVGLKSLFSKPTSVLVQLEEGFVKKQEFEAFKSDVHNQLKDMRSYLHEEMHGIRDDMQATSSKTTEGFESVRELITEQFKDLDRKRSASVAGIYRDVNTSAQRISAVEATARGLEQSQHAQDARIDAIRLPRQSS